MSLAAFFFFLFCLSFMAKPLLYRPVADARKRVNIYANGKLNDGKALIVPGYDNFFCDILFSKPIQIMGRILVKCQDEKDYLYFYFYLSFSGWKETKHQSIESVWSSRPRAKSFGERSSTSPPFLFWWCRLFATRKNWSRRCVMQFRFFFLSH